MADKDCRVFQNICPHNCYCTCGIKTYVKNGRIIDIEGDGQHPFNQGRLCSKGYTFIKKVYHPERILNPLLRSKRGYHWQKITWEKALDIIAEKISGLKDSREIFFDVKSGNLGVLQLALSKLFYSLGPLTLLGNGLCEPAGADAHHLTFGDIRSPEPFDMLNSRYLIIWGGNPAATCTHQMTLLRQVKQNGGKIVVIDPIQTATATFGDTHIRVKPGTDGALALGMIKYIYDHKLWDEDFVTQHVLGWEEFSLYLEKKVSLEWASKVCGVSIEQIKDLAVDYCSIKPAAIWQGLGGQRHVNGGQNYRIINALAAITGNISVKGGGIYYLDTFNQKKLNDAFKLSDLTNGHKYIYLNDLTKEQEKSTKMAFITSSNPLAQYPNTNEVTSFFGKMDFIVTVENFMTKTAQNSHLILPVATFFEKPDFMTSYWHKYIGYNQQAIKPVGESKDEFTIARLLALKLEAMGIREPLNNLASANSEEFLAYHLKPLLPQYLGKEYEEIIKGGYYKPLNLSTNWEDKNFATPSGKIELKVIRKSGHIPAIPRYLAERKPPKNYPYRLITIHSETTVNSQFSNIDVIINIAPSPRVYINESLARRIDINNGDKVRLYSGCGEVEIEAEI
ncbi:MAG: molybdopterin-dependent oxidoreductase, partial [Clostridia bacterium]|nr:molybdopterin-dependent oxidoreductase [Clostridia bacterium]